jgi:drug/metabolite transporter (DMT)-like permease
MPPLALALLVAAGAMHAGWNLLVKRAEAKQLYTWWALAVGVVAFAPLLLLGPALPAAVWPLLVASALVEAVYFVVLTWAYQIGDFSLVYPLARGTAPALLLVWTLLFLPAERPTAGGLVGVGLLVLGLLLVGGRGWWARRAAEGPALLAALATALCISVYTAIDGAAMHLAAPLPYLVALLGLTAVFTAPAVLLRYGGRALAAEWRASWRTILLGGVLGLLTYALVLQAYALAPVSYAGALREVSVVFGALAGWRWLGEGFGPSRTAGAVVIFAGILVIALAG